MTEGQKTLAADGFSITVPEAAISARLFDDEIKAISHTKIKSVDLIIEFETEYWFVEFKNLDNPTPRGRDRTPEEAAEEFAAKKLDDDLRQKFKDTWLFELGSGRGQKPVSYFVVAGARHMESALLLRRTDALKKWWPFCQNSQCQVWPPERVIPCEVHNVETWNQLYPQCPIENTACS